MKFQSELKNRNFTDTIVVHCADTPEGADFSAEDIHEWHIERGWAGIGYHFVIRLSGQIEAGRPLKSIGSHVKGHNSTSIGVCLVGGKSGKYTFTLEQEESLVQLLQVLKKIYSHAKICGHRDLDKGKLCPSFDVKEFLKRKDIMI